MYSSPVFGNGLRSMLPDVGLATQPVVGSMAAMVTVVVVVGRQSEYQAQPEASLRALWTSQLCVTSEMTTASGGVSNTPSVGSTSFDQRFLTWILRVPAGQVGVSVAGGTKTSGAPPSGTGTQPGSMTIVPLQVWEFGS